MKTKIIVIILSLIAMVTITAQSQISLLEMDKIKEHLTLNADQYKTINAIVEQIKIVLEEDKKIISKLRERFKTGDEPGFFEKISVKRARDKRSGQIEELLEDIVACLNDSQKIKYKNIEKPALKALSKKELTE